MVFGGTGDLAQRKLLPALYYRDLDGQLTADSLIIGVARRKLELAAYATQTEAALRQHVAPEYLDEACIARFLGRLRYVALDAASPAGWIELAATCDDPGRIRVFYLATSPDLFGPICRGLAANHLVTPETRVVLEKPIGHDLASARAINDEVGSVFHENQIFRIDHYLGKETVQNLMALRFANSLFEPLWNGAHVDHVQITVAESIGVEDRGPTTSAPARCATWCRTISCSCSVWSRWSRRRGSRRMRCATRSSRCCARCARSPATRWRPRRCAGSTAPARSTAISRPAISRRSALHRARTETFVVVKAEIESWRWAAVPFYLRTGKRMPVRASEIVVQFRAIPHSIFQPDAGRIVANRLVVRLQPDEGMKLFLMAKDPGPGGMRLREAPLNLSFAETFKVRYPDAYERLLMDVVRGNPTLFMRRDEVEAAWAWIEPILAAWRERGDAPKPYTAGTWGPSAAIALIERDGSTWQEDAA